MKANLDLPRRAILVAILVATAFAAVACNARHNPVSVQNEEETAPRIVSVVRMNDEKVSTQLLSGFYDIENGSWRWTTGKFSVLLGTPIAAAQRGATVSFAFSIPDIVVSRLGKIALAASVNGMPLNTAEYSKAGANVFTADIPPAALNTEAVKVDFSLDKTLPPDVDKRDLGVVATSVQITTK